MSTQIKQERMPDFRQEIPPETDKLLVCSASPAPKERVPWTVRLKNFLQSSSFSPEWLPPSLQSPFVGYLLAVLLPILMVGCVYLITCFLPSFRFASAPIILAVVLISLGWGTLSGLLATLVGTLALTILVVPSLMPLTFDHDEYVYSAIMFTIIGISLSLLTSQTQHARRQSTRAQVSAESTRGFLYHILMHAPTPIAVVSVPEYRFELINSHASRCFGMCASMILGRSVGEVITHDDIHQVIPALDWVQKTGNELSLQERPFFVDLRCDGGRVKQYFNIYYQPMFSLQGILDGIIIFGVDITEQVEARQKIEQLLSQLDSFIGVVAHELRTPLTATKTSLQIAQRKLKRTFTTQPLLGVSLQKNEVLGALSKNLMRAEQQVDLQNRLVGDLLDASRMRSDRLELHSRHCDITRIVQECVDVQREQHPQRVLTLKMPSTQNISIMADPDRVGQVVTNYLTNALKYSDAEYPVAVEVTLKGAHVRVSVRDQGPGLQLEQQEHLWDRFYRVPGIHVRSGSGVGLGLGLYICRSIMERLGGTTGVQSRPGEGSTFWFTLPVSA
ncbi:hypothetical protein KSD_07690 [Ktedonobacter sp. SOSP1-85]|uniref:ATP-binding protein n=1 Tax=Ktedonobacter sp. SOSP1-85 TaxID=2778367 RepID=UPI0019156470|nr:ATP-binding protein [Ktedonobacter sp. SOSP1-85]GHO72998.1 hypothetical protein KSD_07690 [Ktedonobacter sp. SOSP1-85]